MTAMGSAVRATTEQPALINLERDAVRLQAGDEMSKVDLLTSRGAGL